MKIEIPHLFCANHEQRHVDVGSDALVTILVVPSVIFCFSIT